MYRIGIDLGGTNIVAGVVDEKYNIVGKASRKTLLPRPAEEIADDMAAAASEAVQNAKLKMSDICSVGIGTPGIIDAKSGVVVFSCNLGFDNTDLKSLVENRLNKETYLENDANAAAYGEFIAGAGAGTNNFIAITIGTGVGGGIIIDKKIYSGTTGAAAELGHTMLVAGGEECSCGRCGCFEAYASATALVRQTKKAMEENKQSIMWELCRNDINNVDGKTAFDAMRKDDPTGKAVVSKYIYYLAAGITDMVNIFQPDVLCIGGGISHEKDTVLNPVKEIVNRENYARNMSVTTTIKTAQLGNDAGIIGAAFLDRLAVK